MSHSVADIQETRRLQARKKAMKEFVTNIPPNLRGYDAMKILDPSSDFSNLSPVGKKTLMEYLDNPTLFLLMSGSSGLGKTALAAGVAFELMRRDFGMSAKYVNVPTLLNNFSYGDGPTSRTEVLKRTIQPDILILDDVGSGSALSTDVKLNSMQSLISSRWEQDKYTIITTNLAVSRSQDIPEEMSIQGWFGESSWDRIAGQAASGNSNLTRVNFTGRTMRGQNNREGTRTHTTDKKTQKLSKFSM